MVHYKLLNNEKEWLEARKNTIGGSEAAAILGKNPYMSNVDLWEIKKGLKEHEDISEKPFVIYGKKAEEHIVRLWELDHPHVALIYEPNNIWHNDKYPWMHASLDGWTITDGRDGILECKTCIINGNYGKWKDNNIPMNYYIQCLHYLLVTEFDYVDLVALLRCKDSSSIRNYHFERSEVEEELAYLLEAEKEFIEMVREDRKPNLILPEI